MMHYYVNLHDNLPISVGTLRVRADYQRSIVEPKTVTKAQGEM